MSQAQLPAPTEQPQHWGAPPAHRPVRATNGLAIASLVTGLMGMAIIPVVLGHMALRQIRERNDAGAGLAAVGLVLGYLALVTYVLFFAVVAGGIWFGVTHG